MERTKRNRFEREEIKRINMDWVKTYCKLTEREMNLLPILRDRKLVRRDHLEIISPDYRNLGSRTRLLNRALSKLYDRHIVDKSIEPKFYGEGGIPYTFSLDRAGSLLLGIPHKKRIEHKEISKGNGITWINHVLPINFRHINGVNQLEVNSILMCESMGYEILEWRLEHPFQFHYGNEKVTIIPDALFIFKGKNKTIPLFIEYDTGSESKRDKTPKIIEEKIIKYRRLMRSKKWVESDWQSHLPQPQFPLILFVTEDESRIDFINNKSKEYGLQAVATYYTSYSNVLARLSIL